MSKAYKPSASRPLLFLTAGLLWTLAGSWLCYLAFSWLKASGVDHWQYHALAGAILGIAAYLTVFAQIAKKNIARLKDLPEKSCFFAFQAWRSYLVIILMVSLGVILRHSDIPRHWLAVAYLTIGGALLGASLQYYRRFDEADGKKSGISN